MNSGKNKWRNRTILLFLGFFFIAGGLWALRMIGAKQEPGSENAAMKGMQMMPGMARIDPAQEAFLGIRSEPVVEREVEKVIRAVGKVIPDERKISRINLRVEGWIEALHADFEGQEVKKGEPLLTLYSPDLLTTQQEFLLALRTRSQLRDSPIPEIIRSSESLVQSTKRRLFLMGIGEKEIKDFERQGEPQALITLSSPVDGTITKKEAFPGMRVTPETALYEITDLSDVWVDAYVYEKEIPWIKVGQKAAVTLEAYPGEAFNGEVAYLYPTVDPETRTLRVRLQFENQTRKLKPEMYANVELRVRLGTRLVVPEGAVVDTGLRQLVYIDQGEGMFMPREIQVTSRVNSDYVVHKGLSAGERVVTHAAFLIDSESKLMASANMMGQLGMADWRMRGAKGMEMKEMPGMQKGGDAMEGMPGM